MKLSEAVRIGIRKTEPLEGAYLKRLSNGIVKACPLGAAMVAKFGDNAHVSSITEVRDAFPEVTVATLLKVTEMVDKPFRGKKFSREDVAEWLEDKGL